MILLGEGPKPQNSMISGFLDPQDPVYIDFKHTKILLKISEKYGTDFNYNIFISLNILKITLRDFFGKGEGRHLMKSRRNKS